MRIFVKFPLALKILLIVMATISLTMLVFAVISLFEVYTFLNWMPAQAWLMLPTSAISFVACIALVTMHYKADDTHLRIKFLFFDILGGRIRIENILNIVYSQDKMYISYIWKGIDPVIANMMISAKKFDALKENLMYKNKNIIFFEDKDEVSDSQQQQTQD